MYDRSAIFKRAWDLRRSGYNDSISLKMAWDEAKGVIINYEIADEFDIHQQEINDELYTMAVANMARRTEKFCAKGAYLW
jgi:hypothetical protein